MRTIKIIITDGTKYDKIMEKDFQQEIKVDSVEVFEAVKKLLKKYIK